MATAVTSCAFAHNVRLAYYGQPGPLYLAYSPVTEQVYSMQCQAGFITYFLTGQVMATTRCMNSTNAVVYVW